MKNQGPVGRELSEETKARIAIVIATNAAWRVRGMSVENLPVDCVYDDSDSRESLLRGALGFNGALCGRCHRPRGRKRRGAVV